MNDSCREKLGPIGLPTGPDVLDRSTAWTDAFFQRSELLIRDRHTDRTGLVTSVAKGC